MSRKWITIGREYGSGGREVGERLSELLNIPCYDKLLIQKATQNSDINREELEAFDERTVNRFFYSIPSVPNNTTGYGLPVPDTLFVLQSRIIEELAAEGSGIFIGRCADYVLQNREDLLSVFIMAPPEKRIERIMRRHDFGEGQAKEWMKKTDRQRKKYYQYYTKKKWGVAESYHLCLDTGHFGIEGTSQRIADMIG